MQSNQRLALIIAGVTLASTTPFLPVTAAIVTQNFTANVTSGPFAGQSGTGSFTYDDALVPLIGQTALDPSDGLTLSVTFLGQTYDESNDVDFPILPEVSFTDGIPDFLDFFVSELDFFNPTEIDNTDITGFAIFAPLKPISGGFETELAVILPIPEPSTWLGLFSVGLLGAGAAFKRKQL